MAAVTFGYLWLHAYREASPLPGTTRSPCSSRLVLTFVIVTYRYAPANIAAGRYDAAHWRHLNDGDVFVLVANPAASAASPLLTSTLAATSILTSSPAESLGMRGGNTTGGGEGGREGEGGSPQRKDSIVWGSMWNGASPTVAGPKRAHAPPTHAHEAQHAAHSRLVRGRYGGGKGRQGREAGGVKNDDEEKDKFVQQELVVEAGARIFVWVGREANRFEIDAVVFWMCQQLQSLRYRVACGTGKNVLRFRVRVAGLQGAGVQGAGCVKGLGFMVQVRV